MHRQQNNIIQEETQLTIHVQVEYTMVLVSIGMAYHGQHT